MTPNIKAMVRLIISANVCYQVTHRSEVGMQNHIALGVSNLFQSFLAFLINNLKEILTILVCTLFLHDQILDVFVYSLSSIFHMFC